MIRGFYDVTGPLQHQPGERAWISCLPMMALLLGLTGGSPAALAGAVEPEYEPDVVLVIKEKAFHMVKGNPLPDHVGHSAFSLASGEEITL